MVNIHLVLHDVLHYQTITDPNITITARNHGDYGNEKVFLDTMHIADTMLT